ncbi:MAG: Rho termination factor N-terminal domain-containing protein [Clostridia bacterium]|nr:Rho termination factor N-terminal domain-containing protein [Clostridia bacterium]
MENYDLEYIENLRIHELRDFARKLGVSSPTTMKKDELIDKVVEIVGNEDEFFDRKRSLVKKSKEVDFFELLLSDNTTLLESLMKPESKKRDSSKKTNAKEHSNTFIMKRKQVVSSSDTPYAQYSPEDIDFTFSLNQNSSEYIDDDVVSVEGYLNIHQSGYGIIQKDFLPSDDDSYLAAVTVREKNLLKGQYIVGNAKKIMGNKPKVLFEITGVDGQKVSRRSINFDEMAYHGKGENYYFDKFNYEFARGERHYIQKMTLKDAVGFGYDLVDENGVDVTVINIKARPEELYKSHGKMRVINIPFNKSATEVVDIVDLILENVKRQVECGKNSVILIYNFCELFRQYNLSFAESYDLTKQNPKAINKIAEILYMTKSLDSKLYCSVVCVDSNGTTRDLREIIELEFLPLFNKVTDELKSIKPPYFGR